MAKLYIIGNGFDLHFDLRTSPQNFVERLNGKKVYNQANGTYNNVYDVMEAYGIDWSVYEESLAYIDLKEIETENLMYPDYLSDKESDRDEVIFSMATYLSDINDAIYSALKEMVEDANAEITNKIIDNERYQYFSSDDAILSFNYTSTIETMFELPEDVEILHIHGYYENNDHLIFGYGKGSKDYEKNMNSSDDEGDYYVEQQREEIYEFYNGWKKTIQKELLNSFLLKCKNIDEVVILGHAMGQIDSFYFEQIERVLSPDIWNVSYHKINDVVKNNSNKYSFKSKIRFFKW